MIVADTNLFVYLYVDGEHTRDAEQVVARDPSWAAPVLWRSEFRNALTGLIRRGAVTLEDALRMAQEAEDTMAGREYTVGSSDVLHLATRSGCSAYDCEYVVLARELSAPLVTADREILEAFPDVAMTPGAFAKR